ncbi:MAG: hypothetical protein ACOWWO_01190 [Peptococcaceae bacterium]
MTSLTGGNYNSLVISAGQLFPASPFFKDNLSELALRPSSSPLKNKNDTISQSISACDKLASLLSIIYLLFKIKIYIRENIACY